MTTGINNKAWLDLIIFLLAFLVLILSAPNSLVAQEEKNGPITEISVSGLKRTQEKVIDALLERYKGIPSDELDKNAVIATLLNTGLFEDIEVATSPNTEGSTMVITLSEKWSIIPIPVFVAGSSGMTAGIAVIDSNSFGLNDKLFAVGLLLPGGWMASAAYVNTPASAGVLGWSTSLYLSDKDTTVVDAQDKKIRSYGLSAISGTFSINAPLAESPFRLSSGVSFNNRDVRDETLNAPDAARDLSLFVEASTESSSWDGVLLSQRQLRLQYSYNFGLLNKNSQSIGLRSVYEHPFFPGFKGITKAAFEFQDAVPEVYQDGPDVLGISILPSDYLTSIIAGASLGFEAKLIQFPFAVLAGLFSYQGAYSEAALLDPRFDHGITGSIRLYIAKVAVPAVDIGVSYNLSTGFFRGAFGIGMRM